MDESYLGTGKRLYLGLVLSVACLLCLILALLWIIPNLGFAEIHPWLPTISTLIIFCAIAAIAYTCLFLVIPAKYSQNFFGAKKFKTLSVKLFLPLAELLGKSLGISTDKVRRSFIKLNNELVKEKIHNIKAEQILILLPHCLQASKCPRRLIHNNDNCIRCGKCVQGDFLHLKDTYKVQLAIATGGTIARRIIVNLKPKLIIAIACERDLASGIQDTYPLPVYGILNERPFGPCIDTTVDMPKVEQALRSFIS